MPPWYQDCLCSFFFSTELANLLCCRLKADKELVKEVYSAAKRFKMDRVKQVCLSLLTFPSGTNLFTHNFHWLAYPAYSQICGDYLLSKMDSQNAISFRNFASSMGDARLLDKVDAFIQDHLLEVSEQEDFLKLPRLKASWTYMVLKWQEAFMNCA